MNPTTEVILNLWEICDLNSGLILGLKGMAYVGKGSDDEKLSFLKSRSLLDFMIAKDFQVPERFSTILGDEKIRGIPLNTAREMGMSLDLFEEVMNDLEEELSKSNGMKISASPIVCITPLNYTDDLKLVPFDNMKSSR
jgi:hypothetical protein